MPLPRPRAEYRRREPESTLLYRTVATELDGLREALAAASPHGAGLPKHVDRELEAYLRCGILAHGFVRVVCTKCRAEHLVGFSCKGRGVCPGCCARRMQDTAAHLVDRVLPRVPFRQWVATFPRRVRYHLAADSKLATLAHREVLRTIFAYQRRRARRNGARPDRAHSNGAVTFVQRFNSALELSLHFHILIPDGVFLHDPDAPDAAPRFAPIEPPTHEEIEQILDRILIRVLRLLRNRGLLDDTVDVDHAPHLLLASRTAPGGDRFVEDPLPVRCARKEGFSLHAGVLVPADDRAALERLARYGLRAPLSLGRLTETADGRLRYEMKRRFSDGRRVLQFPPREFLLRLCALVPPPRFHMVRYAGLFAAHSRGRHALTGRGMRDQPAAPCSSNSAVPEAPTNPSRPRRLDWAKLLRRTFALDVLVCPRCSGPMRPIAIIDDEHTATRILDHLGLPSRAPPRSHPRSPPQTELDFDPPFNS